MACCKEELLRTKKGYKYVELIFGRKPKAKIEKRPIVEEKKDDIETRPLDSKEG